MSDRNSTNPFITLKVSPIFVALVTIAVAAFVYAMVTIARLPTPEEKEEAFEQRMNHLMIAEEAQATGLAPALVGRQWQERDENSVWPLN